MVLRILTLIVLSSVIKPRSANAQKAGAYYNETLIKNITQLLDTILDNYDKKFRPGSGQHPLLVTVDISVRSMGPISEKDMEFSLDCYFRQKWHDERLQFTGPMPKLSLASKVLKDIWRPDTYIKNGRRSYLHTLTMPNILLRVSADGEVYISQRLTIKARCPMYLRKFPMDTQACPLTIGSLGYDHRDIRYQWNDVKLESEMSTELSQYNVLGMSKSEKNISDLRGPAYEDLSVLQVYFLLQRQQGYFILQIYTPCTLIVVMSWVSFWINKEASPARVTVGIMTVLNMSTIGFGIRGDLPKVSYSTALDIFILTCFGFVFAALVEYAVINFAHIIYIRRTVRRMTMFAGVLSKLGEGGEDDNLEEEDEDADSSTGTQVTKRSLKDRLLCRHPRKREKRHSVFYRMAVKAQKARKKFAIEDPNLMADKIDSVSKYLFPAVYFLFNAIYWLSFLYWIPDEIDNIAVNFEPIEQ